jgi:ABC-type branched-subunit amino acid transport system substrate-binding protein
MPELSPARKSQLLGGAIVSSIKKLGRFALRVGLVAIVLMVTACGGGGEKPSATPGPNKTTPTPDTTGVSATEVKWGTHFPLSQNPAAAYAPIAYGMDAFFKYINAQGGVYGRKITLIIGDDHYNPADTVEVVRQLVEQEKVFGILGGLGESTHLAVYKYLQDQDIPDMYVTTGLLQWVEPVAKNRFGGNPDYVTEGRFLGEYIVKNFSGKKVGFLLQNDQLGVDGERGLKEVLAGSDVQIVAEERYESVNSDTAAQTQRLKNAGAEVLVAFAMPLQGASMVKTARETLDWDVPIVMTGIDCTDLFIMLAGAQNAEGIISYTFGVQAYATDDPGVQKYEKIWAKYGTGGELNNFELYGIFVAELTVYNLEVNGPDLSRQSFLDAAEHTCKFDCTTCFPDGPVMTSPTDHRVAKNLVYNEVVNGKWKQISDVVSFEPTKDCTPPQLPADFDKQPKVGRAAEFVDVP